MELDEQRGVRVCREQVLLMVKREAAGSDSGGGLRKKTCERETRKENELVLGFCLCGTRVSEGCD